MNSEDDLNETQEDKLSFDELLTAVFTRETVPVHLLYRLSDITAVEQQTFFDRWTAVDDDRRRAVVRHLADLTENNYVVDFNHIFRQAFSDPDVGVRLAALDGVWDATDTRLIGPITRLLQTDPNDEVRAAAASALTHYLLLAEWGQIAQRFGPPIVEALLAEYDKPDTAVSVKRATLEAVSASNHERITDLINEAYDSDDDRLNVSAVFAMGATTDKRWLAKVMAEMDSPNTEMRIEAARAAGNLGSSDVITHLERLLEDEDYEVQLTAVEALGHIGGDAANDILQRLLEETDDEEMLDAIEEALEEMSLFAGEFRLIGLDGGLEDAANEDEDADDLW